MPAGDNGSHSQVAGSGFGISRSCEHPEEAMKAISVITGPEAEQYLAEQGRAYPARTAQQDAWFTEDLAGAKEGLQAAIDRSVAVPNTPKYTQVYQLFTQYGIQAVNGQMDVPTFLETVQQQAGG
jgi:multiple sugar transport system substrate-binding protein